ncbi:hypothetical protein K2X05_06940 [bacterium]|nr:hypothetical protein [bacterium]
MLSRRVFFLFLFIFGFQVLAFAKSSTSEDLLGKWQALGYYYQGTLIKPDDPRLILTFEFFADESNILYWKNKDESAFCERKGKWLVQDDNLVDEVVWVNPENGMDCGGDPDMQVGKINISRFWVEDGQLFVEIPLADEYLIYVWNPVVPEQDSNSR